MFSHSARNILASVLTLLLVNVSAAVMAAETYPGSDPENAPTIILAEKAPLQRTVTLTEQWRLGGLNDEDALMGVIVDGLVDEKGFTYLLDIQLSQVLVISPGGEHTKTLGREGDGPGEMRKPVGLVLLNDGLIGVAQSFPAKVLTLDSDGNPGPSFSIGGGADGGFAYLMFVEHNYGNTIVCKGTGTFDPETKKATSTTSLDLVDDSGVDLVRFSELYTEQNFVKRSYDEAKSFSITSWRFALAPGGILYTAPVRDLYEIHARGMDGKTLKKFIREFPIRKRTKKEMEKLREGTNMNIAGNKVEIERHILDSDPPISSMNTGKNGNLYISNCYSRAKEMQEGVMARYDVIDPEGNLLEELTLVCQKGQATKDRLLFLDGNSFLLVRNASAANRAFMAGFGLSDEEEDEGEPEPLEVILYSMPD